jgi:hypothetical protein
LYPWFETCWSKLRITEEIVNNIWILMAFWIGATLGFVTFALMQIAREGCEKGDRAMRRVQVASRVKSASPVGRVAARAKDATPVE